ncbi:MAG: hypothetical protein JRJ16_16210 [Deltaproteobacteria bacterium]|nr:hypothetical protein [Deltaproteobacteria bacterium]
MTPRIRLGGFKILKGIRGFSTTGASSTECIPVEFCGLLAGAGVNLPFLVCAGNRKGLYAVFDEADEPRVAEQTSGRIALEPTPPEECAVLSLFPHRENPTILSTFFQVLGRGKLHPRAVALSHSAITAVLPESEVDRAAETLFEPFRFSSYRTPADWKMVRNENQVLYREVVASYQEKRPGVYGVTWADGQILFRVRIGAKVRHLLFSPDSVTTHAGNSWWTFADPPPPASSQSGERRADPRSLRSKEAFVYFP